MTVWHKLVEALIALPLISFIVYSIASDMYMTWCEYCEELKEEREQDCI